MHDDAPPAPPFDPEVATVREVVPADGPTLRIATPTGLTGPRPVIYHVHGGGMIMDSTRGSSVTELLDWAEALGAVAVAVDYRLAPEHPYPVAVSGDAPARQMPNLATLLLAARRGSRCPGTSSSHE